MPPMDDRRREKLQAKVDKMARYRDYRDQHVAVRLTEVRGRGLFAVRRFEPGELILEIGGQLLPRDDYDGSPYVMEFNSKWFLEPEIPAAFLNHSCSPNSELTSLTRRFMGLVAICNIQPGTEICFDYRWSAAESIPRCRCGSPSCRGWVVAEDEVSRMRKLAARPQRKRAAS